MTLNQARKIYKGQTVRAFGKYTGTVKNVWRAADGRFVMEVVDNKTGRSIMPLENEIEIILGYVLSFEELMKYAEK